MLQYGRRGSNPIEVRTSRRAVASLALAIISAPLLLDRILPQSLTRTVVGVIMIPAVVSLIVSTAAAWRVGRNRDRFRRDGIAMIVMSLSVLWLFNGPCLLFLFSADFTHR